MQLDSYAELVNSFWDSGKKRRFSIKATVNITEAYLTTSVLNEQYDNHILGIRMYNDQIFIAQGIGFKNQLKVITPNSINTYDLNVFPYFIRNMAYIYGNFAVVSDHEVIIGCRYINLKTMYSSFFGVEPEDLTRALNVESSVVPTNHGGWIHCKAAWTKPITVMEYWKTSPEHCFDCNTKAELSNDPDFADNCRQEVMDFVYKPLKGRTQDIRDGQELGLSTTQQGKRGVAIVPDNGDMAECMLNINKYKIIFSDAAINSSSLGETGVKISESCPNIVISQLGDLIEYKEKTKILYANYLQGYVDGGDVYDNVALVEEASAMVARIKNFLTNVTSSSDERALSSLFSDRIWWAPIIFATTDLGPGNINYYDLASVYTIDQLGQIMATAGTNTKINDGFVAKFTITKPSTGGDFIKFSGNNLTTYSTPHGGCFASKVIATFPKQSFSSLAKYERRSNGDFIWAWRMIELGTSSTLGVKLILYFVPRGAGNNAYSVMEELTLPPSTHHIDGDAKATEYNETDGVWDLHDFFWNGTAIDWVTTKVPIDPEMRSKVEEDGGVDLGYITFNSNCVDSVMSNIGLQARYYGDGEAASLPQRITRTFRESQFYDWDKSIENP